MFWNDVDGLASESEPVLPGEHKHTNIYCIYLYIVRRRPMHSYQGPLALQGYRALRMGMLPSCVSLKPVMRACLRACVACVRVHVCLSVGLACEPFRLRRRRRCVFKHTAATRPCK